MHLLFSRLFLSLLLVSCAGPPMRRTNTPQVVHVVTLIDLVLVGSDRYRTYHSPTAFGREQLTELLDHYFTRYNDRIPGTRPAIVVHSHTSAGPQHDGSVRLQIDPIVAAAKRYDCDVYVIQPSSAGLRFMSALHEVERTHQATITH